MDNKTTQKKPSTIIKLFFFLLVIYSLWLLARNWSSFFWEKPDRITIVFYGSKTTILSLGKEDGIHYSIAPENEVMVSVPGGYGLYRVGAIGRLAQIQHDPKLVGRAFSSLMSTRVDYSFVPKNATIYDWTQERDNGIPKLTLVKALVASDYLTNANFFERLKLFLQMINLKKSHFIPLLPRTVLDQKKERVYSASATQKKFAGFFYEKNLRLDEKNVKILYTNYSAAKNLSRVIEGEGIRVVDLEEAPKATVDCQVVDANKLFSITAHTLAKHYGCKLSYQTVSGADIVFKLGTTLEKQWR